MGAHRNGTPFAFMPFLVAQKMEHKNILWKVKCSVLNVEDTGEAVKRGSE